MERINGLAVLEKLWLRKLWLLTPALLGLVLAHFAVQRIEPLYQAGAVLYVEQQKIPKSFVADTVTTDITQRLGQIEQQVRRDEILEQIVLKLELYPELLEQGRISQAVRAARSSMRVRLNPRSRTLAITFSGPAQAHVAPAANLIAELVIEENASLRAQQSRGTTMFIEAQIADALQQRQSLAEEILRRKKAWQGSLPEQRQSHQRAIEERQRQLSSIEADIDTAETRKILLRQAEGALRQGPLRTAAEKKQELDQTQTLKAELRRLRAQYTDLHPDVIRLNKEIAAIEEAAVSAPVQEPSPQEETLRADPIISAELQAIDRELERLRTNRTRFNNEIVSYSRKLEVVPEFEEELASLDRQYRTVDSLYTELLKDQIDAELAENLQTQGQSEQLSMLTRASTPSKPYSPKVSMWLLTGLGLGSVLGLGLAFLRDEIDKTFTDPDSLSEAFPAVALLSVIPSLEEPPGRSLAASGKQRRSA